MKIWIAAALALTSGASAGAQTMADCRGIRSDSERLACYDRLPAAGASQPTPGSLTPQIQRPAAPADPTLAAAEKAVKANVGDPASAQLMSVRRKGDAVCGFVNARNADGAYTGAKLFVHVVSTGETHVLNQPDDAPGAQPALASYQQHCK